MWNLNLGFSQKCLLADLIQEIEPLDVSLIQKDVPLTTLDAMKRTISGMLGLLPSDRFQVHIESLWEPLSKLLVSSMMTGYVQFRHILFTSSTVLFIYVLHKYRTRRKQIVMLLEVIKNVT